MPFVKFVTFFSLQNILEGVQEHRNQELSVNQENPVQRTNIDSTNQSNGSGKKFSTSR